jgi:hypothetical protein
MYINILPSEKNEEGNRYTYLHIYIYTYIYIYIYIDIIYVILRNQFLYM